MARDKGKYRKMQQHIFCKKKMEHIQPNTINNPPSPSNPHPSYLRPSELPLLGLLLKRWGERWSLSGIRASVDVWREPESRAKRIVERLWEQLSFHFHLEQARLWTLYQWTRTQSVRAIRERYPADRGSLARINSFWQPQVSNEHNIIYGRNLADTVWPGLSYKQRCNWLFNVLQNSVIRRPA